MKKFKTWCLNNLIVVIPLGLVLILTPIAIMSFGRNEEKVAEKNAAESTIENPAPINKTKDGRIIYDIVPNVVMQAGETRTFTAPYGTEFHMVNLEGAVTKLSRSGKKYIIRADTNASFDLKILIEKGFEHKIKPK